MHSKILVLMSSLAVAFSLSAKTIYVNGSFADYTGHDGSTPELALHTIQDGINAASSTEMDTVLVAPGVYDQGLGLTSSHWFWSSRLLVNDKSVIIRSTDGAAKTFIVGQHGTGTGGYGDDIVRCVCVLDYSLNKTVIIEGFTLQDGATRDVGDPSGQGGALLATSDGSTPAFGTVLVDCVISNCIGSQSQITLGGTLVRCRIEKNSFMVSPNYGAFYLCRGTRFLNCLFNRNKLIQPDGALNTWSYLTVAGESRFVNCTLADNRAPIDSSSGGAWYNTLIYGDSQPANGSKVNTVVDDYELRYMIAPSLGDVRLRAGVSGTLAGDASHVASAELIPLPATVNRFKDLYGSDIPTEGTIAVGASQTFLVPAGGCLRGGDGPIRFDDWDVPGRTLSYVWPVVYPTNYPVRYVDSSATAKRVQYFELDGHGTGVEDAYRYPDPIDDVLWVIPPPSLSSMVTVRYSYTDAIKYADANTAEPVGAQDGSAEHPYKTLQSAVDALGDNGGVVVARPGVYDDGGKSVAYGNGASVMARVNFGNKHVRLVASGSVGETIIRGAADPASDDGCGAGAVQLLAAEGNAAVQGFTLTGGFSGDADRLQDGVGPINALSGHLHVTDSVVTGNHGRYASVGSAWFERCRLFGNVGGSGLLLNGYLVSSVAADNEITGEGYFLDDTGSGTGCRCANATFVGDGIHGAFNEEASGAFIVNSVFERGGTPRSDGIHHLRIFGSVLNGFSAYEFNGAYTQQDPLIVGIDSTPRDYRVFSSYSPAISSAVSPASDETGCWWVLASCDLSGAPWRFDVSGKPIAGAEGRSATGGIFVGNTCGGVTVIGCDVGFTPNDGSAELTVGTSGEASRPIVGYRVNDEDRLLDDTTDGTLTVVKQEGQDLAVVPIYTSVWYVDAVDGDDDNFGYRTKDAFKTLSGAISRAKLRKGDTLLALPGLYNSGVMLQDDAHVVAARAVVPAGVTLKSRDGAEVTVIEGLASDIEDAAPLAQAEGKMHGLGRNAVRGVWLCGGAAVKGFTFRNCYTRGSTDSGAEDHGDADYNGAGAFCLDSSLGTVEDCVFAGCKAFRGAATRNAICVNCRMVGNTALYSGGAGSDGYYYGCLSKDNVCFRNERWSGFFYWFACDHCTVLDAIGGRTWDPSARMINTLVVGRIGEWDFAPTAGSFVNCAFASDVDPVIFERDFRALIESGAGNRIATKAELAVDGDGAPVVDGNVAIDLGDATKSMRLGAVDARGGQRVYNGTLDIGAIEADWRDVYAKILKKGRFVVKEASPAVRRSDDGRSVVLVDGAHVNAELASGAHGAFTVTPVDGAISVTIDGVTTRYDSEAVISLPRVDVPTQIEFVYEGDGSAQLCHCADTGSILILR